MCMWGGGMEGATCLSSKGAKLRVGYYKQFLDEMFVFQKDCWF